MPVSDYRRRKIRIYSLAGEFPELAAAADDAQRNLDRLEKARWQGRSTNEAVAEARAARAVALNELEAAVAASNPASNGEPRRGNRVTR